jgi:hypothetical protein
MAFAIELLHAGALLPLILPPPAALGLFCGHLGRIVAHFIVVSRGTARRRHGGRKHRGFNPFAAALGMVRRDGGARGRSRRSMEDVKIEDGEFGGSFCIY